MPWEIKKRANRHCVVKKDTGETVTCHDTYKGAHDHLKALYANVPEARGGADKK